MWFLTDREPTAQEAMRALRIPLDLAVVSGTLWAAGAVLFGVLSVVFGSWLDALGVVLTIVLGGFATTGLTYLAAERVARPLLSVSLRVAGPRRVASANTVLTRLVVTWGLSSGVPLVGVLLLLLPPDIGREDPTSSLLVLALIGLVVGALATALFARAVALPCTGSGRHSTTSAQDAGTCRSGSTTPVRSACSRRPSTTSPQGCGSASACVICSAVTSATTSPGTRWNMASRCPGAGGDGTVRRRRRLHHAGRRTAAGRSGTQAEPVVRGGGEATNANSGLVNKFQGDAALCVFGAPDRHVVSTAAALRTARASPGRRPGGRRTGHRRRSGDGTGVRRPARRTQSDGVHGDRRRRERGGTAHRARQTGPGAGAGQWPDDRGGDGHRTRSLARTRRPPATGPVGPDGHVDGLAGFTVRPRRGSRQGGTPQRRPPQHRRSPGHPAPNAVTRTRSPSWRVPSTTPSTKASGMDAALVLPVCSRLTTRLSTGRPRFLATAWRMRMLA